jgi:hypothetical protein
VAPPPVFALNPGRAVHNQVLDWNIKAHSKIYNDTVKSLYQEIKDRFDLKAVTIQTFRTLTSIRLSRMGNLILMILGRNLCWCHTEFSLAQMRTCALTYICTNTRAAQDDDMFLTMLLNSISDKATAVMALRSEDCTLNGVMGGLLLFKCLLIHSKVDALNDPALIHKKMASAFQMMRDMKHTITKFNTAYR